MRIHPARVVTVVTLIALAVAACAKKGGGDAATAAAPATATKPADAQLKAPIETHRKVIHTGRIELMVETFDAARAQLETLVTTAGGYVDSAEISHGEHAHGGTIVLRIPADGYGELVAKLSAIGTVTSEATSATDVTDQYVDVAARLTSARALEKRLLELAAERTTATVEQILAIERELARVRGEVEGYEGHVRQWDDQIAMSTLTVTIYPRHQAAVAATLGDRSNDALHGSIDSLRETAAGLLVFAIAILPWALILVPSFLIGRRLWRRVRPQLPKAVVQPPV